MFTPVFIVVWLAVLDVDAGDGGPAVGARMPIDDLVFRRSLSNASTDGDAVGRQHLTAAPLRPMAMPLASG